MLYQTCTSILFLFCACFELFSIKLYVAGVYKIIKILQFCFISKILHTSQATFDHNSIF
jgi:hypothetical protein